jgi:hypothetical protein
LRFDRDRRGYETTALMHVAGRGRGKRLLYWFRTPPGVRVGRAPIDETAIRLLEQHNPDVQFDWTRILKAPPLPEGQRRESRDRDQRGRRDERGSQRSRSGGGPPPNPPPPPRPAAEVEPPPRDIPALDHADQIQAAAEHVDQVQAAAGPTRSAEPEPLEPPEPAEISASAARLGAEGLVRLRARYAEVMARIAERPLEEVVREELKLQAERLNPDAWVTADEVTAALEQYETVFESLRGIVGRQPRHRRR